MVVHFWAVFKFGAPTQAAQKVSCSIDTSPAEFHKTMPSDQMIIIVVFIVYEILGIL